jgi:hypothetical protein
MAMAMDGVVPGSSGSGTGWSSDRPMADMGPVRSRTWLDPDELDSNYSTRVHRTVRVSLPPGGRDYNRGSFAQRVEETCGLDKLEACGPIAAGHVWMLTLTTLDAKERFANARHFVTREGAKARVSAVKKQRHASRLHWIPFHVPVKAVVKAFERYPEITVISASYDKSVLDGMKHVNSLLRTIWIETESPQLVPLAINWHFEGQSGQSLVTMKNRAPVCLKCFEGGHMRKDCPSNIRCGVCARIGHDDPLCGLRKSWASVGAPKPAENAVSNSNNIAQISGTEKSIEMEAETLFHDDLDLPRETVTEVTSQTSIHVSTPIHVSIPDAPGAGGDAPPVATAVQDVTYAMASHTPNSPKRAAQEGGANAASAPVPRSAEWPTPLEACTAHASHATIEGFAEAPGTSVEPSSIPDTQPEARADDTSANSDNISQFTSPPVDISQDLVLSKDYEMSEDNDQAPKPGKSSSSETEAVKYSKEEPKGYTTWSSKG